MMTPEQAVRHFESKLAEHKQRAHDPALTDYARTNNHKLAKHYQRQLREARKKRDGLTWEGAKP